MAGGDKPQGEVATMAQLKAMIRRRKRRHPEHSSHGLNIYPMMDMMTILLVFMVMQFSTSTAAVVQESEELKLPYSISTTELDDATPIQVSRSQIVVDGVKVVDLRNGQVDPSDKRGGTNGFEIMPLSRELNRIKELKKLIAQRNPARPFTGEVQIVADKRTPFRTISEILYTLGQNEFSQLRFVTSGGSGVARANAAREAARQGN